MERYIKADDALVELNRLLRKHDDDLIKHGVISGAERTIIPKFMWEEVVGKTTADVVEVVRCKECILKNTKNCPLDIWATIYGGEAKDDFYCGLGRRAT